MFSPFTSAALQSEAGETVAEEGESAIRRGLKVLVFKWHGALFPLRSAGPARPGLSGWSVRTGGGRESKQTLPQK